MRLPPPFLSHPYLHLPCSSRYRARASLRFVARRLLEMSIRARVITHLYLHLPGSSVYLGWAS